MHDNLKHPNGWNDGKVHDDVQGLDMCRMASMMMCRGSEYAKQMCNMCADMCEACAMECEKMGDKMEVCKQCADMCRKCAQECRSMMR